MNEERARAQQYEALDAMVLLEETRRRKQAEIMLQQASETIQCLTAEVEKYKPKDKKTKKVVPPKKT